MSISTFTNETQYSYASGVLSDYDLAKANLDDAANLSEMSHLWFGNWLKLFGTKDEVGKYEWKLDDDHDELKFKIEFKVEDLLGKDSGYTFTEFDATQIYGIFDQLGMDYDEIRRFELKENEIKIEIVGHGVEATPEEVAELVELTPMAVSVADADGNLSSVALYMGDDPEMVDLLVENLASDDKYSDAPAAASGFYTEGKNPLEFDSTGYEPTTSEAIITSFHDYDTDRDVPDRLVMTEDIWFGAEDPTADYKLCKSSEFLSKMEWDYSRGGETLKLQVDFKTEGLFGENPDELITEIDLSSVDKILADLGATHIEISKLNISDDRVEIEMKGEGISISDEEVFALPGQVDLGLTVQEPDGETSEADLDLCVLKFDPHSPVTFDLNEDGEIGVTGSSTAHTRLDGELGETVSFDIDGDGEEEQIEWLSGDGDGLLVDNRDGNALDDMSGVRLFGDQGGQYVNGYHKMSELLDANQDGVLTGEELTGLQFWIDDGDAVAEENEFVDVQEYGVSEIGTGYFMPENTSGEELMRSWAVIEGQDFIEPPMDEPDPWNDFEIMDVV